MRFTYTAERGSGEVYSGELEARDRFELYTAVRREGGKIISVAESENGFGAIYRKLSRIATVKQYDRVLFARNLGAMLSAGLSLTRALTILERQTKNARFSDAIGRMSADVRRGSSFHDALAKFPRLFDNLFVAMVRAGEEGGSLPEALSLVSAQLEQMYQLKKKIQGALIYPVIILVAIIGIGALMLIYVVPTLSSTFAEMNIQLPASTKLILGASAFLVENTVLALVLGIMLMIAVALLLRTSFGRSAYHWLIVKIPLIGEMVREVNAARTARTLASLLSSGVGVIPALEITGEVVQNVHFRKVIKDAAEGVGKGEQLSVAFVRREDLYPAFVGEMMSVGEETGGVSEMLKRVAAFYEDEVNRKTKDLSTIIEPFLMLIIGGSVGFFAVAMITPIYSISSSIG
jgi:type IV pilus assembly protein PilC